jgi:hypothetical protein
MPLMSSELYDALREANVSEEKARKAAEAVAAYDTRFAAVERKLEVLTWMVSFHLILTLGILWRVWK